MRRVSIALACVAIAIGAFSCQALGQVPESDRKLVTDPDLLASMGFPRDATNVYIGNKPAPARTVKPTEPSDFGGGYHFTSVNPKAFIGRQDLAGTPWQYTGGDEGCCQNLSRKGSESFADAAVELPTGANLPLGAIRWWANNSNTTEIMAFWVFENCHPSNSGGPSVNTEIAHGNTTPSSGNDSGLFTLLVFPYTVNNRDCRLTVRVRFDATTGLTLQKVRIAWNRQVSPAPVVATFSDVPTSHPFFKFVEALVAAGITSGCGGGNYCPDSPLTRGQMAVFLSVALGLYWQ